MVCSKIECPPEYGGRVVVLKNGLLQERLGRLRTQSTESPEFRSLLKDVAGDMAYEVVGSFEQGCSTIDTGLGYGKSSHLDDELYFTEVLRAGQPFLEGMLDRTDKMHYKRKIAVIGASRDGTLDLEKDSNPDSLDKKIQVYNFKGDPIPEGAKVIIADPMLAAGSTIRVGLGLLGTLGDVSEAHVVSLLSAPFGIEAVLDKYPMVTIWTLSVDKDGPYKGLNKYGYIIPGLGDAGDRAFGTVPKAHGKK